MQEAFVEDDEDEKAEPELESTSNCEIEGNWNYQILSQLQGFLENIVVRTIYLGDLFVLYTI